MVYSRCWIVLCCFYKSCLASSIYGCPSGFHLLVIVSHAAVGLRIDVFKTPLSNLLRVHSEVGLLDHNTILFLNFWVYTVLFSTLTERKFAISPARGKNSIFLHPFQPFLVSVSLVLAILTVVRWSVVNVN